MKQNINIKILEYISTLEGQVNDHKMAAETLKEKLVKSEEENKKLRKEMDMLKRQNQILLSQQQQQQQKSPRIMSSPLPKPNLNKDISIMGTKATDSYRQDNNCILVSNAIMPVWDYNAILSGSNKISSNTSFKNNEYMNHLVGQFLISVVQLAGSMPSGTNQIEDDDYRLPLMPDDRDFSSSSHTLKSASSSFSSSSTNNLIASKTSSSSTYSTATTALSTTTSTTTTRKSSLSMEDLYDALIQSALINSSNSDKSFWWWDNSISQSQTM
jgi:regulator of replication initiation timing